MNTTSIELQHTTTIRTGTTTTTTQTTGTTFPDVHAARRALVKLALDHDDAPGGVTIETDSHSPVPDALQVIVNHWDRTERYHLDAIAPGRDQA